MFSSSREGNRKPSLVSKTDGMKKIKEILLWIWQLPQNLAGLVVMPFYKKDRSIRYKDRTIRYCPRFPGGISLGFYVYVGSTNMKTIAHEWGHTRQSNMLGPLYLLVIGLPSIIWAAFYRYDPSDPHGYYRFYTEKWADKLGGVIRN